MFTQAIADELIWPGQGNGRSFVTLSYAQSLDGSISKQRGQPTSISGAAAMRLTHRIRACHDAILVGIGTVLADDPSLTVRHVAGPNPRPIILDSRLRFPATAKMLRVGDKRPFIATAANLQKQNRAVAGHGVQLLPVATNTAGQIDLARLLQLLPQQGIDSVMVEGGATVITSFLTAQLVDRLIITIAPRLLAGLPAISHLGAAQIPLPNARYFQLDSDLIVIADL